jgi:hypothetical protein
MSSIRSVCSGCGAPLQIEVAGLFGAATVAGGLCPRCTDRQFSDGGGVVLSLDRELPGALFSLGKVTITAGALSRCPVGGEQPPSDCLRHHA